MYLDNNIIKKLKKCDNIFIKYKDIILSNDELKREDINNIREAICNELLLYGFCKDDYETVNKYGAYLEELIDELGHYI